MRRAPRPSGASTACRSTTFPLYYPGDDGCDWVGINLYSVAYYDNNPRRPAFQDNPLALIDPIYKMYAARKPIAICEYAASHMAAVDRKPRVGLAVEKMSLLYGALPRLYPRIKMIDWFNMNNLLNARPGRQLNNYSLTSIPNCAPLTAASCRSRIFLANRNACPTRCRKCHVRSFRNTRPWQCAHQRVGQDVCAAPQNIFACRRSHPLRQQLARRACS
jgi:hypothetical protein